MWEHANKRALLISNWVITEEEAAGLGVKILLKSHIRCSNKDLWSGDYLDLCLVFTEVILLALFTQDKNFCYLIYVKSNSSPHSAVLILHLPFPSSDAAVSLYPSVFCGAFWLLGFLFVFFINVTSSVLTPHIVLLCIFSLFEYHFCIKEIHLFHSPDSGLLSPGDFISFLNLSKFVLCSLGKWSTSVYPSCGKSNPLTVTQAEAISYSLFSLTARAWLTLDNENQKSQYLQSGH